MRNAWHFRRWRDTPTPEDYARAEVSRQRAAREEAMTPRPEPTAHVDTKTAGQLALPDRGASITVDDSGLAVRGILLDFTADYALEWDMTQVNPHVHTGLVTLTITGVGHHQPVEIEVSPTTTVTLTRWRTP